jgi:hypothetical protein
LDKLKRTHVHLCATGNMFTYIETHLRNKIGDGDPPAPGSCKVSVKQWIEHKLNARCLIVSSILGVAPQPHGRTNSDTYASSRFARPSLIHIKEKSSDFEHLYQ